MKKIFWSVIFLLLTIFIFGDEIVVDEKGNKIVIKDDKTWEYLENYRLQKLAENNLELLDLNLTGKRSGGRTLSGKIKNKGNFEFKSITLKVKFKQYGEYITKEVFEINNLKSKQEKNFKRRIDVRDIDGRDYIVEIFSFK